ncbi:MAG: MCE family protein [Rhodospirillaceae bacterium]|mgnify:FL=1|jgi:phospholipid/cholesterol/gamma-HCH transport system substrate-binding protein|nr:MCE family protein [Rhodospirillaceae bacterium]MBT6085108.1 MCE family protein [Rhodospirillaceae bacterium]MBT6884988.1 MCE family protein [Rhodospirillaceae bacterium]MBT7250161.1 MCE family protein [Rhodospirillaceae bacterium]MBT7512450.1 MCE family protein [Rhodospirillaceae bacterium]
MGRNAVETILGAMVLAVAGMFVFFAYGTAQVKAVTGYEISANFFKIGGLTAGSDVRINGIKVGAVKANRLDPKTFDAVVEMSISAAVRVPNNSTASIGSEGIVGGKYIRIEPGNAKDMLKPGGRILKTKDFRSLEDQVGEIIFLATGGK